MSSLLAYVPFRDPLWGGWDYWYLMLVPLGLLVAVAYKGIRLEKLEELPKVAIGWTLKLLGYMVGLALVLWLISLVATR